MRTLLVFGSSLILGIAFVACGGGATPTGSGGATSTSSGGGTSTGGGGHGGGSGGAGGAGGSGGAPAPIVWGPCPENTAYTSGTVVECATIDMPLDHASPGGEQIPIFVARLRSGKAGAAQLWMIDGGPGSSGEDFFWGLTDEFAAMIPDVDIYVPAHRGTGRSAGLVCAGEAHGTPADVELSPAEWQSCIQELQGKWGAKLALFNVTGAAQDLGTLIERAREPASKVFVYGLSYGTYLGLRYLELYPEQADGVILDSIVTPGTMFISKADEYFDPVAHQYADLCKADATCNAKLGPDPWTKIQSIVAAVHGGHCAEAGFTPETLRYVLGGGMMGWYSRLMSLALLYRLDRCSPEDVTAIQTDKDIWLSPYDLDGFSHGLEANVSFSELWESPAPSAMDLVARNDAALFSLNWGAARADAYGAWPRYTPDEHQLSWPTTSVPVLMLNGTLDTETPFDLAKQAETSLAGPHHTFVSLPNAPHGGGYQSPTLPDNLPCGVTIMASFVKDPKAAPDTSCIAAMKPLAFEDAKRAKVFFGTGSVWENIPPAPQPPPPRAPHTRLPGWTAGHARPNRR